MKSYLRPKNIFRLRVAESLLTERAGEEMDLGMVRGIAMDIIDHPGVLDEFGEEVFAE